MRTKVHYFKSILTAIVMAFGVTVLAQPGTSIAEAIEVNSFPYTENINTITNGVYVTTLGGTSCNNLNCCPALVYKVTLPDYGSLQIENLNYQANSGSIIAYTSAVENPSDWGDLEHWNYAGNICNFKNIMSLGTYCNWEAGTIDHVWQDEINGTPIDENNPEHVVPPGVYYVLIMNYNQYVAIGGVGTNFIFNFSPYDPCNPNTGTDIQIACDSYTWIDNNIYTESNNTATLTLTNAEGCDSIVTLNLTIKNSTSGSESISECDSYTWQANDQTYTESGTHTATLVNSSGCDSVATLELTILESSSSEVDIVESEDNYTAPDGTNYTEGGTFVVVIENSIGCDSTITINLTFNEATDIQNNKEVKAVIYPNPTNEEVNIRLQKVDDYLIQVYSTTGNLIFNDNFTDTQEISFSLQASPGVYNIIISSENHEFRSKIMIVKK